MYQHGQPVPLVKDDVSAQMRTNYVGFVSFTILIWDHIDTLVDEIEYIWKRKKGLVTYLFLLNRYLTPLGFIVNLFAYLSPVWTTPVYVQKVPCNRFIRYEGAMTMIGLNIVAIMLYLRVYALYLSNHRVLFGLGFVLLIQIGVNAWLLTNGQAVVHNPDSHVKSCTMIFNPSIGAIASSSAWLPLLYDTLIFILVAYRTVPSVRRGYALSSIMPTLLEDGLIYYTVICSVTLVLTLMIVFAQPGLKNITAQLELLLTVAMMSRITLNLKKSVANFNAPDPDEQVSLQMNQSIAFARNRYTPRIPAMPPRQDVPRNYVPSVIVMETGSHNEETTEPPWMSSQEATLEEGRIESFEHLRP